MKNISLQEFIDLPTFETISTTIRDNFYQLIKSKKLSRENYL